MLIAFFDPFDISPHLNENFNIYLLLLFMKKLYKNTKKQNFSFCNLLRNSPRYFKL